MATKMRIFSSVDDIYKALSDGAKINDRFEYSHPTKTGGKIVKLSLGRIWFNMLQPNDFPLIDHAVKKKEISQLISNAIKTYTPEETSDYITKMNQESFRLSSYIPTTFDVDSLILPDEIKEKKKELQKKDIKDIGEFNKNVKEIANEYLVDMEKNGSRIGNISESGSKDVPWNQLAVAQGFVCDVEGNIRGPIKTSFTDGHSPKDFYISAAESRRGFFYKAAISSKPGYLSRRVTMANAHIKLDDSIKDCGTKQYFKIQVDKNLAKILSNRYIYENGRVKLLTNPEEYIGKTINLRSPLYCKSESGICPICYGKSWEKLNNKNIGILVGGDINNKALNACATRSTVKEYKAVA